ncbi:MAG: NADH-quinone oxidoreductase subunit NuoF [Thermoplasmatales archaeon]|nr:MAG: NADH-quinone oxidoreductase subunit NuoF [Thermoplasmatales archaeon]
MNFNDQRIIASEKWDKLQKKKGIVIYVGAASCGRAAGCDAVTEAIRKYLKENNLIADILEVGCIGLCCFEPLVYIQKDGKPPICYANLDPKIIPKLLEDILKKNNLRGDLALGVIGEKAYNSIPSIYDHPMLKPQVRIVLRNCGIINPTDIDHYIAKGGYVGINKALKMKPEEVIEIIKKSGIRGRGGAGFPTALKWEFSRNAKGEPKYIVCNADEGDPGAFMNRSLLEGDPHAVLEGMLIASYTIGAPHGYIYIREEYPLAIERLRIAIQQMLDYNLLGEKILGTDFSFDIEIKEGAGAFVCGEETALLASLMGQRGMPRTRPPFPATSGIWGKPTVINNVETLGTIATIIREGWKWYSDFGSETSKGTKTFSLVGKVKRTGLIEVPLGTMIKEIVHEVGGGILNDKKFKAVQTGGPSGGCIPASKVDLGIDYESLTSAGATMGSGGLIVLDNETCMVDIAHYFLTFTQEESCGKCTPCRVGTKRMLEILEKIKTGNGEKSDLELLEDLAPTVKNASLCGLGQTAPNPVISTLRYFKNEYEEHIKNKRCPALVCKELIAFDIDAKKCIGCGLCKKNCPVEAISGAAKKVHIIDKNKCIKCGICYQICPVEGKAVFKISGGSK